VPREERRIEGSSMFIRNPKFTIYFGNKDDKISKTLDCVPLNIPIIQHIKYAPIANKINVKKLAFLNQVHKNDGLIIKDHIPAFEIDGDYLITAKPHIGIGVLVADCLPIAIYDQKNHSAAMVHAGWKGTIARIIQKTIIEMQEKLGTDFNNLQVFFGPSAKVCCYEVSSDFLQHLQNFSYSNSVVQKVENKLYLNVPLLNLLQLQEIGIHASSISQEYNVCTICDHRFYSYRRQGQEAGRQMSIITLRDPACVCPGLPAWQTSAGRRSRILS
jgi:purine-nucleoside/S-methyl-5'-thioadenosine phosphorylase / adenosine deaminase